MQITPKTSGPDQKTAEPPDAEVSSVTIEPHKHGPNSDEMVFQTTSSKTCEGAPKGTLLGLVGSLSPANIQLVRPLARSAAVDTFKASLIKPNGANDAK